MTNTITQLETLEVATLDTAGLAAEYREIQQDIKRLQDHAENIKQLLISAMDGKDEITAGLFTVRNKVIASSRFDSKRFKLDHLELALAYTMHTTSTRFTVA